MVYCVAWYRRKKAAIKKIGKELDNRGIIPVIIPSNVEQELRQLGFGQLEVEEGQCTVPLNNRTHKNSSSSDDSGVCSQPPSSPPHQVGCTRQDSGVSGISACAKQECEGSDMFGYTREGSGVSGLSPGYTREDSGVSGLSPLPRHSASLPSDTTGYISMSPQQSPVSGTGYCHVGTKPYLPLTFLKQDRSQQSPGYLSLGQAKQQLVLQPSQNAGAYSRVGAPATSCYGCESDMQGSNAEPTGVHGVARLKKLSVIPDINYNPDQQQIFDRESVAAISSIYADN